jgi:tRNA-uridine 2-sulfurtransferase
MKLSAPLLQAVHEAMALPGDPGSHRVVCAMSGGVDSSVTAALLKLAGYDVVGITLQLYDHGEAIRRKGACCAGQDIHDARRVSAMLDIPHYVLDFESRFREAVIDDFVAGYLQGSTPIPCVKCNQTVKFADLLWRAQQLDASALVTGHYIDSIETPAGRELRTPADLARDQSYFLFATTQEQVNFLRFPLGRLTKTETRAVATELGLLVADKPDSQDICFVPDGKYADLILKLRPDAAGQGDIVHLDGRVIGRHEGIIHYTIGQRRGLNVMADKSDAEPLYVVKLDAVAKRVYVGPREALKQHDIVLQQMNWLGGSGLDEAGVGCFARIRSTRPPVEATVRLVDGQTIVTIPAGEYGVSPGQACVLYAAPGSGQQVLGGGFIASRFADGVGVAIDRQAGEISSGQTHPA